MFLSALDLRIRNTELRIRPDPDPTRTFSGHSKKNTVCCQIVIKLLNNIKYLTFSGFLFLESLINSKDPDL